MQSVSVHSTSDDADTALSAAPCIALPTAATPTTAIPSTTARPSTRSTTAVTVAQTSIALAAGAALAACGGGGGGGGGGGASSAAAVEPQAVQAPAPISSADASRLLAQSSMGASRELITRIQSVGIAAWIDEQMAMPQSISRFDWLLANGYADPLNKNTEAGFDAAAWKKMIGATDTLRQRVTFALSEIIVVAIEGLVGSGWHAFSAAAFLDLLEANAFGNYRTLLQAVSTSAPMGEFLTFRGNVKFNPVTGAQPDENYAREIMQLFSIGLVRLNQDGSTVAVNGVAQETYTLDDITGLARVFTGWDYDLAASDTSTPEFKRRPMVQFASRHETGEKKFIGTTIPAGTDGVTSLRLALDALFAHPNCAPFISRQLIQRLVCSNPSAAYISRITAVFNNDGSGVKGNLNAVVKALLLDDEARAISGTTNNSFGKLREPILRLTGWARAFGATSPSNAWAIGNTADPGRRLGQSPLRSPSVFNFFRPGYVPPNTPIASAGLVAPEFQITNESTVVSYINFMQRAVSVGLGDVKADYSALLPLADNATTLVAELHTVLAAEQLRTTSIATIVAAVSGMPAGTDAARFNRIYAALTLVLAAPEFIVQK